MDVMTVNGTEYRVIRLLGRGKGGYSYLVEREEQHFVLKQIHHEHCAYYTFGDKLQSELRDYAHLSAIGVPMPKMLDVDLAQEHILKEYIPGNTVYDLVKDGHLPDWCIPWIEALCIRLQAANTNIDYFPTNFIPVDGTLFYVDYECNAYMEEWNFANWGVKYWSKTPEFLQYMQEHP
jgi:tRNA A-37 threonylcarbamoyl transferase component Bud32